MNKFFTLLLILLFFNMGAYANVSNIEQNLQDCLKGLSGNIPMANCAIKASNEAEKEINNILPKIQDIKNNQSLWELYKNSTETAVNSHLEKSLGTMYYLLSKNNTYVMNLDRLFVLNNINKKIPYNQERYLSDELKNCLSKSSIDTDKIKCYNKETELHSSQIDNYMNELQSLISKEDYSKLKNNQLAWFNYKNDTEKVLSNKTSNLIKAQIIKELYSERNGLLLNLIIPYKNF